VHHDFYQLDFNLAVLMLEIADASFVVSVLLELFAYLTYSRIVSHLLPLLKDGTSAVP
jgi:hypothetical protein